jgi:hypothetical protein
MADRPAALNTGQWGVETTLGSLVACSKRLLCTYFDIAPSVPVVPYRPTGFLTPVTAVAQKESTTLALNGSLCFNDLPYLLSSLLKTSAPSVPSGATLTNRWVFAPSDTSIDAYKSYTLEKGTATQAERVVGAIVRDLTLRWTRTDANLSGSMMGQYSTELVTITPTPTDIAAAPIDPKAVSIYVGTTFNTNNVQTVTLSVAGGAASGGTFTLTFEGQTTAAIAFNANAAAVQTALRALTNLGINVTVGGGPGPSSAYTVTFSGLFAGLNATALTGDGSLLTGPGAPYTVAVTNTTPGGMTKLTRVNTIELALPERKTFAYTLDDEQRSWSYAVVKGSEPRCTVQLEHDSVGAGIMASLRARSDLFCKILCRGTNIETVSTVPWPQALQITFPFKYIEPARGDVDDVYMSTYQLALMYNSAFGGSLNMTVDSYLASL